MTDLVWLLVKVGILSTVIGTIFWAIWSARSRFDVEYYGTLSEFLIGAATVVFGAVSVFVALDLSTLQRHQRQDAALDRVAATLQWWRTQRFREETAATDKDNAALTGRYYCIVYLKNLVSDATNWTDTTLLKGPFLMDPMALAEGPQNMAVTGKIKNSLDDCTSQIFPTNSNTLMTSNPNTHFNASTPLLPMDLGQEINIRIHSVLDIPDIALAEWSRLQKDPQELGDALDQLNRQTVAEFCASKYWKADVYGLFDALDGALQDAKNQGHKQIDHPFAHAFVASYPNLYGFLKCVCRPIIDQPRRPDCRG